MKIDKSDTVKSLKRSAIKFSRNMFGNEIFPGLWFIPGGPGRKPGNLWGSLVANIGVMAPPPLPNERDYRNTPICYFLCALTIKSMNLISPETINNFHSENIAAYLNTMFFIREGFISALWQSSESANYHSAAPADAGIIAKAFQRDRLIIGAVKCLMF